MMNPSAKLEQLLMMLRSDDPPVDPDVESDVLSALRRKEPTSVIPALADALQDVDVEYRCTIASIFLRYDYAAAIPHVGSLLHDEDDGVRGFLCMELGAHHRREAVPLLVDALKSDLDGTNRTWAAWALGNIGDPAALPSLKLAMQNDVGKDDEGRTVKEIAAEAIRRITQEKLATSVA